MRLSELARLLCIAASVGSVGCSGSQPLPLVDGGAAPVDGGPGADGGALADGGGGSDGGTAPGPPTITSLVPSSAIAGGVLPLTLGVVGRNFLATSIVRWNAQDRPTQFVDGTRLRATIRTTDLSTPGTGLVTVFNPPPDGTTSNEVALTIEAPIPFAGGLSPSFVTAGGNGFTLRVNGSRFVPTSIVRWNGSDRPTVQTSAGFLDATIAASDIASPGVAQITVVNPPPGGGVSSPLSLTIFPAVLIERVSVSGGGAEANGPSGSPALSAGGRIAAFESEATNLVEGDGNGVKDVFVRDLDRGTTFRASVASDGGEADAASGSPALSANGRFVAFVSAATHLVAGDGNDAADVFVRDLQDGTTTRVSVSSTGAEANGESGSPSLSADGRLVVFWSMASNLVEGDGNGFSDVFLHDMSTRVTIRVSVSSGGAEGDSFSGLRGLSMSADARFVFFQSDAANLAAGGSGVLARDRLSQETLFVQGASYPSAAGTGRFVAYQRRGPFIGDVTEVYWSDRCVDAPAGCTPASTRLSASTFGNTTYSGGTRPSVSVDGRFVGFESAARLMEDDTNGLSDIYVRDTCTGAPSGCVSRFLRLAPSGVQANGGSTSVSLSSDGRFAAFESEATNLVPDDTNGARDIFVANTGVVASPVIVTATLPGASLGLPYAVTLSVLGGTPPFAWSLAGGALPDGLALDGAAGSIAGTPAVGGTSEVTIRVTDASVPPGSSARRFQIVVQ
jgi:Tol biopolymer transport system component